MKILKHKNIMGLIYSALLCMPLLAIGVRTAYVICNKNAYQSYYGETINEVQTTNLDIEHLEPSYNYTFNLTTIPIQDNITGGNNIRIYVDNFKYGTTARDDVKSIGLWFASAYTAIVGYNQNNENVYSSSTTAIQYSFYVESVNTLTTGTAIYNNQLIFTKLTYNNYSYLDNVFEYSVNKFVSENNLGQINMFSWFTNLFLSDNATNNLYVGFANWYMNYAMLISCMHLLFLVLMWFVNYSRRLLDRGMNYDW